MRELYGAALVAGAWVLAHHLGVLDLLGGHASRAVARARRSGGDVPDPQQGQEDEHGQQARAQVEVFGTCHVKSPCASQVHQPTKRAGPKPVPPRKGRPAALGASPSRIAQQGERGVKARSDSGGASFHAALRMGKLLAYSAAFAASNSRPMILNLGYAPSGTFWSSAFICFFASVMRNTFSATRKSR